MEEKVGLKVGDIYHQTFRVVKPSEMIKVNLLQKGLNAPNQGTTELVVECGKGK